MITDLRKYNSTASFQSLPTQQKDFMLPEPTQSPHSLLSLPSAEQIPLMKGDYQKAIFLEELTVLISELLGQTSPDLMTSQGVQ